MSAQSDFNATYWPAQPPAVQALPNVDDEAQREAMAYALAGQGYIIDVPIMVYGWDPYLVMKGRQDYGYTWVPSALMHPVDMVPGVTIPGAVAYDPSSPPPGAITVTTLPLPPFVKPAPTPIPAVQPASLVGKYEGGGLFQAFAAAVGTLKDGDPYNLDPRGPFIYHQSESPFAPKGIVSYFTPKAPAQVAA